ncbi:polyprenyl synthetase family protein [Microbacterium sediminicola]|uniref:Polyprenyl synthetase family protein n=1 Tax=Microbacterium sediminicola TaxID=415210 RepID=A0ABN2HXS3_9MICO
MSPDSDAIAVVSQRVEEFLTVRRGETRGFGGESDVVQEAAEAAVRGGKRLRARFCLTGWEAVREHAGAAVTPDQPILAAAAALEIFHAAALVHDDIVDHSDTRRGKPAAHRALEAVHRDRRWDGDATDFGLAAALLLGDLLVAWSDDLLEEGLAQLDAERARAARREYSLMRREVTVGQFLDVAEESAYTGAAESTHADRALAVASLKSARYSIQRPLGLGARVAGGQPAQCDALAAFGHPLGMAFQLRDDVLGVFGDESQTGKPAGDDLREGKRTVLIAYAREGLTGGARRTFDELVGDPGLDAAQIATLQRAIEESGALARTEELIADYARRADKALIGAPLGTHAVGRLRDLATAATERAS